MKKQLQRNNLHEKLLLLFLFAIGCTQLYAQTNVTGNQFGTWTKANSPYIIKGTVTVPVGKKLIIEPGVEVRSLKYDDELTVNGILYAVGTAADSIRFNGFANPAYTPSSTHGGLIYFNSSNATDSTVLAYTVVDRMGDKDFWTSDQTAIEIGAGKVTIRNSSIRNSEAKGIYGLNHLTSSPLVKAVSFSNNPIPASFYTDNVSGFSGNTNAIISLRGDTYTGSPVTIPKPGTASYYVMEDGSAHYFVDSKVTIQPGVEIRSNTFDNIFTVSGTGVLVAKGTATDSIRFRGFSNTAYAGTSTHGGIIYLNSSNKNDSSVLSYVAMDRMGDKDYWTSDQAALEFGNGRITVRNSSIRNSELIGIYGLNDLDSVPVVANVSFVNNPKSAVLYTDNVGGFSGNTNAAVTLRGNTFARPFVTIAKPGANSYYIMEVGSAHNFTGKKVTIQPGVEIRSTSYDNIFSIGDSCLLVAKGTATDSIKFIGYANTSYTASSTHGGIIYLNSSNATDSSVLAYVAVDRMGDKDYWTSDQAALEIGSGKVTVRNSNIRNSENRGIFGLNELVVAPVITGNVFSNNPIPAMLYSDNVGGLSGNTGAVVTLRGGSFSAPALTIPKAGTSSYYIMEPGSAHYFSDTKLSIQPGVEIRSTTFDNTLQVTGTGVLNAKGTVTDSIKFIGLSNTAYAPTSTHGGLIYLNSSSTTDSSVLQYVVLDRMGDKDYWTSDQAALEINGGKIVIKNSSIRNSEYRGIFGYGDASGLTVKKSNIYNNKYGADFTLGKPLFYKCNIVGNTLFGINNQSTVAKDTVDARTCWWGDASGPKQNSTNPTGKGNAVSLKVLYKPFLTYPYQDNDLGVDSILSPSTNCSLSGAETVKVRIRNFGSATQTAFSISYKINNAAKVTENVVTLHIESDSTAIYTFITKANLSVGAGTTYNISAFTALTADTITINDSTKKVVVNPKPNLGRDTTVSICPGSFTNLKVFYDTTGYTRNVWSASNPTHVGVGVYTLIVTGLQGCKDTAKITVLAAPKPSLGRDTAVSICPGTTTNIKVLYDTTGYTSNVWSATKPEITSAGNYTLIVTNSFGCKDTAAIGVINYPKPNLGKDTTVKICIGKAADIRNLYNTTAFVSVIYNTPRPDSVGKGVYKLIVTNNKGCKDTAVITVDTLSGGVKPVITKTGNSTFCLNDSLVLTTNAVGNLQWLRNNSPIKNATTNRYVVNYSGGYKLSFSTATSCTVYSDSVVAVSTIVAKPSISLVNDTLVSSSAAGNQWYLSGKMISGATGRKYSPNAIGAYTVQVTSGGCKSEFSDVYIYTANTFAKRMLAIADEFRVQLYPNPTNGFVRLLMNGNAKAVTITVTDLSGRVLLQLNNVSANQEVNLSKLQAGLYLITVSDGSKKQIIKMIKE